MSKTPVTLTNKIIDILRIFEIDCYNTEHKPIRTKNGNDLEFDIIGHIGDKYGLIIEVTEQKKDNKTKIEKFMTKCRAFLDILPKENLTDLFQNLGIPTTRVNDFSNIVRNGEWRFIYIGLGDELLSNKNLGQTRREQLYIFNKEHYNYLLFLKDRLGRYGRYELLHALNISLDMSYIIRVHAIKYANRHISRNIGYVDLYVFLIPVKDLLKMARVARYGSLDSWIPEIGTNYQRLLSPEKLKKIKEFLDKGKPTFPNAITVVLNCKYTENKIDNDIVELQIPIQYSSIEVIDGQHRLFAFSQIDNITEDDKLITVGLKFKTEKDEEIQQWSARTFVEINREQTKVPTELIYLIQYNSMGESTPEALAARILIELNNKKDGPLERVFHTRPFMTTNKVGGKPVRIVTIVKELKELFNPAYKEILANYKINENKEYTDLEKGKVLIERYFSLLKQIFKEDWGSKDSLIFTTKYIAAFCRLFIEFKCKQRLDDEEINRRLENLRDKLQSSNKIYFKKGNERIPQVGGTKSSNVQAIYKFLYDKCICSN
ncbi:MAG: DGQHR domain-containing protein [Candidatus Nitrosocaldaceae archaeon]